MDGTGRGLRDGTVAAPGARPEQLTPTELAEAIWLATRIDAPAGRSTDPRDPEAAPSAEPGDARPPHPPELDPPAPPPDVPSLLTPIPDLPAMVDAAPAHGVSSATSPSPAVLPDAAGISRALRPLKQYLPTPHVRVLDELATAERAADDDSWFPEFTHATEPRWEAAVVIDDHISMAIWREAGSQFVRLLQRQGAFRDVRVSSLTTDTVHTGGVTLRPVGTGGSPRRPGELLTATGRRIVFVLTDGIAPAWRSGATGPVLHLWARRMPVVIIHMMPREHWYRTGVSPRRLRLRAPTTGVPNARLGWRPAGRGRLAGHDSVDAPTAVPVPVLELAPRWLGAWAQLVAGTDHTRPLSTPALLVTASPPAADQPDFEWPQDHGKEPRQRVHDFMSWATATALVLAKHLAAAPLNLPVMRLLQHTVPGCDTSHLAEIVNSGLLRPLVPASQLADSRRVTFEFEPGVREEFLAAGHRADTARVLRLVGTRFSAELPAVAGWQALLADPANAPAREVTPETAPVLRVEKAVLRALSGSSFLKRARELEERLTAMPLGRLTPRPHPKPSPRPPKGTDVAPQDLTSQRQPDPQRRYASPPPIWGSVPPRNPNFTGRQELLEQLHQRMQVGPTAVLPHALHGMGGVGKSQLAVEYVYQHQDEYELVWWIPAERVAQIGASLVELAQRMELDAGPEVAAAVPAVREALRLGKPYRNWLLVFDNAESPEAVRGYFPADGPGRIMVTSRNPNWSNIAKPLEVDVFARVESIELLRRRGPEIGDEAADRLAEALGDLPLAIEQAAAWRAETGMSADEYLRLFEEKRLELLEMSAPVDYQVPLAAAWNVSLDRLVSTNPAALRLLQVCAFFAAEPISRGLLAGAHNTDVHPELNDALRDPIRLNRAIREINRYSLARIDHRTNSIQMHRLVQAVLVGRMPGGEREAIREGAHRMLASGDRNDPYSPENWRTYTELYPHVMESGAVGSGDPWVQQLVDNVAKYLYYRGEYGPAKELARHAYDSRRASLDLDAPATLTAGRWLGFMLFVVGEFTEAAALNAEILAAYQRSSRDDSEDLLAAIGAVAADRRVAGDFRAALDIDEDLYQRHVSSLGVDDPSTLNAAHNLAVSLRLVGDLSRAREIDQDTFERRLLLFGEDHAFTLQSQLNLITDRRELGEYREARVQQQQVVDRLRQVLSPGNPQILKAMHVLASAIRKAGEHLEARAVSEETRTGFASQYGDDHPDTVAATVGLAIDLRATGDLDAAIQLGEEVHQRYQRLFGESHPHTVAARLNLAVTYRLHGDPARAQQVNEAGLAILTERLGADHPLTLAGAVNLGSDLYVQRQYQAAYDRDQDTADRLGTVLGTDHPTTLICLGNLAMDLVALGRHGKARQLHSDTVERFHLVLGEHHAATQAGVDLTRRGDCDLDPLPL